MQPDRANVAVAVMDPPRLLSGVGIAAAGEGGHDEFLIPSLNLTHVARRLSQWGKGQLNVSITGIHRRCFRFFTLIQCFDRPQNRSFGKCLEPMPA